MEEEEEGGGEEDPSLFFSHPLMLAAICQKLLLPCRF
jgi:hypothetical protein